MLEAFLSPMSIVTMPAKGERPGLYIMFRLLVESSVLEYLFRDDADRAVRELDGKELRGRPVRVTFDDSVRFLDIFCLHLQTYCGQL
jgi:hypothetical protein